MNADQLQQTIAALQTELTQIQEVDPTTRQSLSNLASDISRLTGPKSDQESSVDDSLSVSQKLRELAAQFDARYPRLTAILEQLIDNLGEIGI